MITRVRLPGPHAVRSAGPGPRRRPRPPPSEPPVSPWGRWLLPLVILTFFLLLFGPALLSPSAVPQSSYSDLVAKVNAGQVRSVVIDNGGGVRGTLTDGRAFRSRIPPALGNAELERRLEARHVEITASHGGGSWVPVLVSLLPLLLVFGLFLWAGRQAQQSLAGGIGGFGRSKAKLIEAERPGTRFHDIAGYDGVKQEISEIVDFLRHPGRYAAAGAKPPRGVLMVGPPGTGKTLMARAVAGEAEVAFLSVTGSAFVEMFVGVGASRVRDMFEDARRRAPSIVFIDEIDAIGGKRGGVGLGGHEEREQTLNQLLAEMDGFDQSSGIVVLAATNRPETLDPALLRPGRFDRQVTVPLPNQAERAAILAVHAVSKRLAPAVDLDVISRGTPGFSGADLANLVNEAAINAVRAGRTIVMPDDLDAARDRVLLGRRDASNALLPDERRAVAVHESGHAVLAALCEHADPVAKVTILPAGVALGVTEQLPEAERHLYSQAYLTDLLTVRLGGRAAELVVFGEGSTGAAADLTGATQIAGRMVREFGLSPALGPVGYGSAASNDLGEPPPDTPLRLPYSEHTQELIDAEVATLLRCAEHRAVGLLRAHRGALDRLTTTLLRHETVDGEVVLRAVRDRTSRTDGPAPS
jgi:cell division protease FtsH